MMLSKSKRDDVKVFRWRKEKSGKKFHTYLYNHSRNVSSMSTTNGSSMLSKAINIHHATSCVNHSVSPSISPSVLFFVGATPFKLLNRILWNFVVMKDKLYKCAYLHKILIHFFSSGNNALLNFDQINHTTETLKLSTISRSYQEHTV